MGARGNSGVIFSQIVRGFADVLGERDPIDEPMVARAFRSASDAAYRAVRRPVEGTMLTVIREMAEAAESPEARDLERLELLALIVARGEESLARTPELLAVLKEAGVVDAGGAGLVEIIRGRARRRRRRGRPGGARRASRRRSRSRRCTRSSPSSATARSSWSRASARRRRARARARACSATRCSSSATRPALKVHVHTDDPGAALSLGTARGDDRRSRDRRHAPADPRARGAPRRRARSTACRPSRPASSSSRPARGTVGSSRACGRPV